MIPYERQELIVKKLEGTSLLKLEELHDIMPEVSLSTLRRDIKDLERAGRVEMLSGGAVKLCGTSHELSFSVKNELNSEAKEVVARLAAAEVKDGETVFVDSGTTATALLRLLVDRDVTIYTTNTVIASLSERTRARILLVGGLFDPETGSLVGAITECVLGDLFFDRAFIGINAVDELRGAMTPRIEQATTKRLVKAHSNTVYLLCDSSKFHQFSNVRVFGLEGTVVVSEGSDAKIGKSARLLVP